MNLEKLKSYLKILKQGKINGKSKALFTRQLATLTGAGLSLLKSLETLSRQNNQPALQEVILSLASSIRQGNSLSESLKQYPKVFDSLYINMVKSGEAGGMLEEILEELANYQEKSQKIQGKIISAMIYPIVVLCIAVAILCFLMIFIIPKFTTMFEDMGIQSMPLISEIVFSISKNFLATPFLFPNFIWLFLCLGIFFFVLKLWRKSESGKRISDSILLKIPILGPLLIKGIIIRFSQTLGTLISSGVPILNALDITKNTINNEVASNILKEAQKNIKEGESFSSPLKAAKLFPPMLTGMVEMGEETGQLDKMLLKVSKVYEEEIDNVIAGITSILEVVMIVFLAFIVGTIVLALFLPLIKLIQNFNV